MTIRYVHQNKSWPKFTWDSDKLSPKLEHLRLKQGRLIGKMEALGFSLRDEAVLQTLTEDVLKSSEIEGEFLDRNQVRSSIAQRLGMGISGLARSSRDVEGVVEMMLDATQKFDQELTTERLFAWHVSLFLTGRNGMEKITVGNWRDDAEGPMQVVSGPIGKAKIHFQAPEAKRLKKEMRAFIAWFNGKKSEDSILQAGITHFWFVTVHPFDDGNGRIGRAIADMCLARSEGSSRRFYSLSSQICSERKSYYEALERAQKGDLDITDWLEWFLMCLDRALTGAEVTLASVLKKAKFWEHHIDLQFNDRHRKIINQLLDRFEGKLTSSKWASMAKCSQDTASRDIQQLLEWKVLKKNPGGGRSTSYSLNV